MINYRAFDRKCDYRRNQPMLNGVPHVPSAFIRGLIWLDSLKWTPLSGWEADIYTLYPGGGESSLDWQQVDHALIPHPPKLVQLFRWHINTEICTTREGHWIRCGGHHEGRWSTVFQSVKGGLWQQNWVLPQPLEHLPCGGHGKIMELPQY